MKLKGRSFLSLLDYSKEEIEYLIDLAFQLKAKKKGLDHSTMVDGKLLEGKNIVLIFDKTSTRTRCSFEVAAYDEGANVTYLTNSQAGKKESIEDTAKVLGRLYDGTGVPLETGKAPALVEASGRGGNASEKCSAPSSESEELKCIFSHM